MKDPPLAFLAGTSRIAGLICERLTSAKTQPNVKFVASGPGLPRNLLVDDLLPIELATAISDAFPHVSQMRRLDSFRERKYTSKSLERFDQTLTDITFAFQHPTVLSLLAEITGYSAISSDPQLYAGGLSTMVQGDFLHPHIDNSHDQNREKYRVLNALYYVSQNWSETDGGGLELWDERVRRHVEIPAVFNRLVIMETNAKSFHSVNEIVGPGERRCVSNYFFSPISPNAVETEHVTYFRGRPEDRMSRILLRIDSDVRSAIRKAKKSGLSRSDTYTGAGPSK